MKKITRWSPDTCGCIIDYEWDTEESPETRKHEVSSVVRTCPAHAQYASDKNACFQTVHAENKEKNKAIELLYKNHPYLTVKDHLDREIRRPGVSFSFDENRVLEITHKDLKEADKATFQSALEQNLGNKRVKIK